MSSNVDATHAFQKLITEIAKLAGIKAFRGAHPLVE